MTTRRRLCGHGPLFRASLYGGMPLVLAAAMSYPLAGEAAAGGSAPPPVEEPPVTAASWCVDLPDRGAPITPVGDNRNRPVRVADEACSEDDPADAGRAWPHWVYKPMPPVVFTEQDYQSGEDEDGSPTYSRALLPDWDQGGMDVPVVGAYDEGDTTVVPIVTAFDGTARGLAPRGGRVTPSGAGSAGFAAFGGNVGTPASPATRVVRSLRGVRVDTPAARPRVAAGKAGEPARVVSGSSSVARGGLGVTARGGGGGGSSNTGSSGGS